MSMVRIVWPTPHGPRPTERILYVFALIFEGASAFQLQEVTVEGAHARREGLPPLSQ